MKALQLVAWQQEPELREVPVPEPGPGQVLIKVGGAGACHSDLHVMEWPAGTLPYQVPFTLGHENAGWVEKTGFGVEGFAVGDPVAVYGPWGCGYCYACSQGIEVHCENAAKVNGGAAGCGLGLDGGMAEYMLVPSPRFLVPLGSLAPEEAAPLTDAALTPYHAIKRSLPLLTPRASAVVIGVGGLGHLAIQILRALTSARIIAVDISEEKLKLAAEVGADATVLSDAEAAAKVAELTRGQGAELVLDLVGLDTTLAMAAKMARKMGHLTVVGMAGGTLPYNFFAVPAECAVVTPYWGSLPELVEVVALAERGQIRSHNAYYPLERAHEAYRDLRAGTLAGRAVIVPNR
ncbi:MAG: NAD(P)-dependent alcohol dehydrogenase [Desulfuromonadales bacterium]|nr:NAD(P)-dependent alcohol dehydrogenase [Desulfuromonadales bacterium]